jgi:hypothetical protein
MLTMSKWKKMLSKFSLLSIFILLHKPNIFDDKRCRKIYYKTDNVVEEKNNWNFKFKITFKRWGKR